MALVPPNPAADLVKDDLIEDDDTCRPEHCFHAFDTLYCALEDEEPISPEFADDKYPLFVTWNTRSSRPNRSPRLRGCIGTFTPQPLREGIATYAIQSAFHDTRFNEIQSRELKTLECGISLLTDYEEASSYLDWTIGVHGIYITLPHPSLIISSSGAPSPLSSSASLLQRPRRLSRQTLTATYLPDVIPEQGWDKIQAIDSAIQKAGWDGAITEDIRRSIKLTRYQSRKCVVGWNEYAAWREKHTNGNGDL